LLSRFRDNKGYRAVALSQVDGAGGESIGHLLAHQLGFGYLNEAIVAQVARDHGVDPSVVAGAERRKSFFTRVAEMAARGAVDVPPDPSLYVDQADTLLALIRGYAARRRRPRERGPGRARGLLDHLEVGVKHNETSHFTELLERMDLAGAVVTFDALHTVRANLAWLVRDKNAHYIAIVKRNQPRLHAQVRALPWRQVPGGGCTRDLGHGRAETRTVKTAHVSHLEFPAARQAIKITRWRQDTGTGRASRQTVYAVTSLTSADATARDLARLVREHWSVEAHHHVQ